MSSEKIVNNFMAIIYSLINKERFISEVCEVFSHLKVKLVGIYKSLRKSNGSRQSTERQGQREEKRENIHKAQNGEFQKEFTENPYFYYYILSLFRNLQNQLFSSFLRVLILLYPSKFQFISHLFIHFPILKYLLF